MYSKWLVFGNFESLSDAQETTVDVAHMCV